MEDIKKLKKELLKTKENKTFRKITNKDLLSTGSTLLNLACSNKPFGGFLKGSYIHLVGDSSSGKTFISLTCFAEACIDEQFQDYRLIFDNVEKGALMDIEKFFGKKVAERAEAPRYGKDGTPIFSEKIEEFYYHLDDVIKDGRPFIYVLDSMDSLSSKSEDEKFQETKKASRKGNKVAGSYGDGKAKINSSNIRLMLNDIEKSGSILIVISQTRDNVTCVGKTNSGGKSLKFYSTLQIWSSVKSLIRKNVRGKPRVVGSIIALETKKNRIEGIDHKVNVPIYISHGFDDIGSCIEFLIEEGHWTKNGITIDATEFDTKATMDKLVSVIENSDENIKKLRRIVGNIWNEIREGCKVKRKKRYE